MRHTLKLLLKIVLERCRSKIRPEIAQCQYGFMPDKGTRNAIFTLRMLSERSIQHQQNIYICFIDYKKAFDRVRHKRLFKMLKDVGLDEKDQRITYNLYHLQKGAIKLPNGLTEWTEINRGVRQGCVMSPDFFNLYSEHILRRLEESNDRVTINGVGINNIRYADDTALIAVSEEGLQRLLDLVLDASSDEGLDNNCKNTFCMVVSKERQPPTCNLICNGTGIEQVNYLGSMLSSDGRCEKAIRRRIGMAKTSFNQMSQTFNTAESQTPQMLHLVGTFVWLWIVDSLSSVDQEHRGHINVVLSSDAPCLVYSTWNQHLGASTNGTRTPAPGPSKRDKHVLPATSYGKANSKERKEGKRWTKASFPQSSDGKHRTNIPENHMGRRKKSNFENKNIMSRLGSYRLRHGRERDLTKSARPRHYYLVSDRLITKWNERLPDMYC